MTPKRISIAGLMGLVGLVAVGLVALKQANPTWASVCFTLTIAALGVGIFHAAFARGRSRTFGAGFGLAGSLYLVVVYGILARSDRDDPPPLLTHFGIVQVQEIVHPETVFFAPPPLTYRPLPTPTTPAAPAPLVAGSGMVATPLPTIRGPFLLAGTVTSTSFEQIGQSLWTLPIATAGGFSAARLVAKQGTATDQDSMKT